MFNMILKTYNKKYETVVGTHSRPWAFQKMLLQPDLDLDKAVLTQVLQGKAMKKQQPILHTGGDSNGEVAVGSL